MHVHMYTLAAERYRLVFQGVKSFGLFKSFSFRNRPWRAVKLALLVLSY